MVRAAPSKFRPDFAIPNSKTIEETLEDLGVYLVMLTELVDRPLNEANELLKGNRIITPEMARDLEMSVGLTATFWMNLESDYHTALERLERGGSPRRPR